MLARLNSYYTRKLAARRYASIYHKYRDYTMISKHVYAANLELAHTISQLGGDVVECGVWKGGMIAGLAEVLGRKRRYVLCDSFAGLPPAKPIDGKMAIAWQEDVTGNSFHNNCTAAEVDARRAMSLSPANRVTIVSGWFENTLSDISFPDGIALLRLDGDWYDSTMACLRSLYRHVVPGGLVMIDDYYQWDGCARAVHEFILSEGIVDRIFQWENLVCFIRRSPRLS